MGTNCNVTRTRAAPQNLRGTVDFGRWKHVHRKIRSARWQQHDGNYKFQDPLECRTITSYDQEQAFRTKQSKQERGTGGSSEASKYWIFQ